MLIQRRLAEKGLRVTPQRVAIYEFLVGNRTHPTAAAIYAAVKRQHPMISPATVYKTLEMLVQLGLVAELAFADGFNRYDTNPAAHVNVVCTACGGITDIDDPSLAHLEATAAHATGFKLEGRRHELYGVCPDCQEQQAGQADSGPNAVSN